jgi:hypothetical protein
VPEPLPPPCTPIGETFLYKVGLNSLATGWLSGCQNIAYTGVWAYYEASPTRSVGLDSWRADVSINGALTRVSILEVPSALPYFHNETPPSLKLLTMLQYSNSVSGIVSQGAWTQDGSQPPGVYPGPGTYNLPNYLGAICYTVAPVPPPPSPPVAPPPSPAVGTQITDFECWSGIVTGWVMFNWESDGSLSFSAELDWYQGSEAYMDFKFPAPSAAQGLTFIAPGWSLGTAVNAQIVPDPDNPLNLWLKSSYHTGFGLGHYSFHASRVKAPPLIVE